MIGFFLHDGKAQDRHNKKLLNSEVSLLVENDVFTSFYEDSYYSSGIFARYSHVVDTSKIRSGAIKSIRRYEFLQRIYTAKKTNWSNVELMDRPYAGTLSLAIMQDWYYDNHQYLQLKIEIGWMGPGSLTGDIHQSWHRFFGLPKINGWHTQLSDAPLVNAHTKHAFEVFKLYGKLNTFDCDLSMESNLSLGTIYNHFHERALIRLGRFESLERSMYYGNTLGDTKSKPLSIKTTEIFLFYSPGVRFTIYDGTLQGGLIARESVFTKQPNQWVFIHSFGFMARYHILDIGYAIHHLGKETNGVGRHKYGGIILNLRF